MKKTDRRCVGCNTRLYPFEVNLRYCGKRDCKAKRDDIDRLRAEAESVTRDRLEN